VGRPLWREVGYVVSSFCWAPPAQPFSGLSPTGLMSIFHCLYFWDRPTVVRSRTQATEFVFVLFLRLPKPGGPSSCIYFPQEGGSPVIPPRIVYMVKHSKPWGTPRRHIASQKPLEALNLLVTEKSASEHSSTCRSIRTDTKVTD
jgi:hypothetical protein